MIPLPGLHNYSDSFSLLQLQFYGQNMEFERVTVDKEHFFHHSSCGLSTTAKLTYQLQILGHKHILDSKRISVISHQNSAISIRISSIKEILWTLSMSHAHLFYQTVSQISNMKSVIWEPDLEFQKLTPLVSSYNSSFDFNP